MPEDHLFREGHRKPRGLPWVDGILQDVRFAIRTLRRHPGITLTAIATLAIGIGANTGVLTVAKAALFAGFPLVDGNDRILYLSSGRGCCVSYPDFEDWRAQAKSFQGIAVVRGARKILDDPSGLAESYDATEISADTFKLVGRKPLLGRDFTILDEIPGAAPVVILSYGFWERRFGKDPTIVGHTVRINGAPTVVIGVMPQGFSFPQKQDLWTPLIPTADIQKRGHRDLWFAFGRVAEGVTIQSVRAEMELIGRRLGKACPVTNQGQNLLPRVQTFNQFFIFANENTIYLCMWGAVAFILLIACANLANLMLARALERSREISLRIALGAGRWRITRQIWIESLILSGLGASAGWWIAKLSVRIYSLADRGPGRSSWRILDYTMDHRIVAYTIAISIATAILFGLLPAIRFLKLDLNSGLKEGARGATGGERGKRLSAFLVIGEVALAVVLLAGAGVMVRSFLNIYNANLGVQTKDILTAHIDLPAGKYPNSEAWSSFFARLQERLETIPGVQSVAIAEAIPTSRTRRLRYDIRGASSQTAQEDNQSGPNVSALAISPGYFATQGAGVLSGREFNDMDGSSGAPAAIVNERFASKHWPSKNPVGKTVWISNGKSPGHWRTIVGVASNIVQNDRTRLEPLVYLPYQQMPDNSMEVILRTLVPPATLASTVRREVQALDSDLPVFGPLTLTERLEANYWSNGLYGVLFLIFAAIALLLASVGLYAVVTHSISQRTREIGVRLALGATKRDIRSLVLKEGMLPVGIGLTAGLVASFGITPILKSVLVQVSSIDPITLTLAAIVLMSSAIVGCMIPAHRAMSVDPVVALRHE